VVNRRSGESRFSFNQDGGSASSANPVQPATPHPHRSTKTCSSGGYDTPFSPR
jgi:hypothetical protein